MRSKRKSSKKKTERKTPARVMFMYPSIEEQALVQEGARALGMTISRLGLEAIKLFLKVKLQTASAEQAAAAGIMQSDTA